MLRAGMLGVAAVVLAACGTAPADPERLDLTPASYTALPGWREDRHGETLAVLGRSCRALDRAAGAERLDPGAPQAAVGGSARAWRRACADLARFGPDDHESVRAFVEARFEPFAASAADGADGLFTGYYEPEVHGSRRRHGPYATPLHGRPADLVTVELGRFRDRLAGERITGRVVAGRLEPYPERAEIDAGAMADRAPVLFWLDDPVDAFFLEIQGSGRVKLDDASAVRVGYDGDNGRPYVAIGRELVRSGALAREAVSMQSIRTWMAENPDRARALMDRNPSYVFFREIQGDGPVGTAGVALTPGRSLAVDRRFVALGALLWLDVPEEGLRRLVVAQDTGGAIRGPVRGDLFWGTGAEAGERAGRMRALGRYWVLLPRED